MTTTFRTHWRNARRGSGKLLVNEPALDNCRRSETGSASR